MLVGVVQVAAKMLKIMCVAGTRPEAIKMAPVVRELEKHPDLFTPVLCVTGQHRQMLDQVLDIFDLSPDHDLNIMQPEQTLASLTGRLVVALDAVIGTEKPDWILVQGDTTSAMVAGLVAFYHQVKIGHIEAGLRTQNKYQPYPEEINRRITDVLADLYFAPTERARANLLREGVNPKRITITGNTVIDALLMMAERVKDHPPHALEPGAEKRLILVTSHRRENFGQVFQMICQAIQQIALRFQDSVHIVYPVHYNPEVRMIAHQMLSDIPNITLTEPLDYETIVTLMSRAYLILTDSGGLQEEAPSLNKPLLVMRDLTERQEIIEIGAGILVGTDSDVIVRETARLLDDPDLYKRMANAGNPYGDGKASHYIAQAILHYEQSLTPRITPAVMTP